MKKLKKYLWLKKSEISKKSNIDIKNGEVKILPDTYKVKVKRIAVLTTLGCTFKNYCKVILKDHSFYFVNKSMQQLISMLPIQLKQISKHTVINVCFVKERFNHSYVFVKGLAYKVSDRYKENLKEFFDDS